MFAMVQERRLNIDWCSTKGRRESRRVSFALHEIIRASWLLLTSNTTTPLHFGIILSFNTDTMSNNQTVRHASHAGSWYSSSKSQLDGQLEGWLSAVKPPVSCIGPQSAGQTYSELPVPGARVIIAPYV